MSPDAALLSSSTISFDASASTDDTGIKTYAWDFGDGISGTGKTASHQYTSVGNFNVTLTVTDGDGASDSIIHTVSIANSGSDPLYGLQWHLKNTGQYGWDGTSGKAGEDINVEPVWNSCSGGSTCRGEGVYVAVVDDGMEIAHPDLQDNVSTSSPDSFVYTSNSGGNYGDPTPTDPADAHGTAVSGIIAPVTPTISAAAV